jgi:hypothetical protein
MGRQFVVVAQGDRQYRVFMTDVTGVFRCRGRRIAKIPAFRERRDQLRETAGESEGEL